MNIDKIDIYNNGISVIIYPKEKKLFKENKKYNITESEILDFLRIIRTWQNKYEDNQKKDGIIFSIKIYYDGKIDEMKGRRALPDNYKEFDAYVKKIYDRR